MDIVKVHYDEELQGVYGDDCRYFFDVAGKSLGEEVVKRINMHDELVDELEQIKIFLDEIHVMPVNWITKEGVYRHAVVCELLERCK